jgi:hypothetical protein
MLRKKAVHFPSMCGNFPDRALARQRLPKSSVLVRQVDSHGKPILVKSRASFYCPPHIVPPKRATAIYRGRFNARSSEIWPSAGELRSGAPV